MSEVINRNIQHFEFLSPNKSKQQEEFENKNTHSKNKNNKEDKYNGIKPNGDLFASPNTNKYIFNEKVTYSPYVKREERSAGKCQIESQNINILTHKNTYMKTTPKKNQYKLYSPNSSITKSEKLSDRFIPINKGTNLMERFKLIDTMNLNDENVNPLGLINNSNNYEVNQSYLYDEILKQNALQDKTTSEIFSNKFSKINGNNSSIFNNNENKKNSSSNYRMFSFKEKEKPKENFCYEIFSAQKENETNFVNNNSLFNSYYMSTTSYKQMEIENLIDDFYLNLLDWSVNNIIAIGCNSKLLLFNNINTTSFTELFNYENENDENHEKYISSLIWSKDGNTLAVGNSQGMVELYDVTKQEMISSFSGHQARVGVVAWNNTIISSGSKDCQILSRDVRCPNNSENIVLRFQDHQQEVCGLKWSFDGTQLASGGNDNQLMLWNLHSNRPLMINNSHLAAVKAIAWSPHQHNLLATGGGTADRTIRLWNTTLYQEIGKYDTGSQVCNLVFSQISNELVSTHGFSLNQIYVWKINNGILSRSQTLTGHSFRVLYLGLSPNGQNIVTAAGDKTLRFWNVFHPSDNKDSSKLFPSDSDFR